MVSIANKIRTTGVTRQFFGDLKLSEKVQTDEKLHVITEREAESTEYTKTPSMIDVSEPLQLPEIKEMFSGELSIASRKNSATRLTQQMSDINLAFKSIQLVQKPKR